MILLLGGSGYVGSVFAKGLTQRGMAYRVVSRRQCDYTRRDQLVALIDDTRPSFLINAAGYTGKPNVEACEQHKAECLLGNAVLPGIVREACQIRGLPWGHVSSGCIYNGVRADESGFCETDPPNFCFRGPPCSFYSGSKALGEERLAGAEDVFVWRLRIPFSHRDGPRNYLSKLMRYDRLLDVTNSLADIDEFVDACLHCWLDRVPFGIYNIVNSGSVSTRDVVDLIRQRRITDRRFCFFRDEAEFMEATTGVPRSSCVLDNSKLVATGFPMREVGQAIDAALERWQPAA
ncbi:dTDP-4-dehydrorhamnose reductase [Stieleria maiorica]|uniref:dTDP-4-dehydrorhamnose reductase n=1 Tax=Stieleria maiorica TaxID=2795974 RepID=A0A5B9MJS5_9BACT|nr:sugar nucleotide-binding protein [Stieleria maiorica]QEG00277.1 dTDP-4-dehydrorhamnose reductase [Stieleria maiorica]